MATIKETFTEFYAHGDRIKLDATLNGRRDLEEIQVGIDETYPNPTSGDAEAAFVEMGVTPAQIYDVNELLFTARIAFGLDEDNLYAQALTNGVDGVQLAKKESGNITIDETTRTADEWRDDGVGFATDTAILYLSADSSEVVAVDEQWEGDIKYFLHQTWMTIFELHNICATLQEQEAIDLWDMDGGEKVEGYVVRYVEGNADGFNDDFYCTPTGGYEGIDALEGAGYSLTEPEHDSVTLICYFYTTKISVSFSSSNYGYAILDEQQAIKAQDFGLTLSSTSTEGMNFLVYEPNKYDYEVVDGLFSDDLATYLVYSDLSNLRVGSARGDWAYAVAIQNTIAITTQSKTWKLKITKKPESEEHVAYFNSGVGNDTKNVTDSWGTAFSILGTLYPKDSSEGVPYNANKSYIANEIFWSDGYPTELTSADVNINDKNWQGVSIGVLNLWSKSTKTAGLRPCGIKYGVSEKAPTTYYFWKGESITIPQTAQYNDPYGQLYTAIYLGTGTETLNLDISNAYEIMGFDGDEILPADLNKLRIVSGVYSCLGNKITYNNGPAWLAIFGALSKSYTFNNISIRVRPRVLYSCPIGSDTFHEETVSQGTRLQLYDYGTRKPLEYNGPDLPLELFRGMCTYRRSIGDSTWYEANYAQFTLMSGGLLRIESNYSGKLYAFRIKL